MSNIWLKSPILNSMHITFCHIHPGLGGQLIYPLLCIYIFNDCHYHCQVLCSPDCTTLSVFVFWHLLLSFGLFFWFSYKIEYRTSSEALLVSFMYILSLYIQSQSACDSAHSCKPFLQNYCLSISYPYSVCRLIIYSNFKTLALFLVGLQYVFTNHFINFSNLVCILNLNSYLFTASYSGLICELNS